MPKKAELGTLISTFREFSKRGNIAHEDGHDHVISPVTSTNHDHGSRSRTTRTLAVMDVFVLRVRPQEDRNMTSVEDLDVFKLAHQLALKIYGVTKRFPKEETFNLWIRCDGRHLLLV